MRSARFSWHADGIENVTVLGLPDSFAKINKWTAKKSIAKLIEARQEKSFEHQRTSNQIQAEGKGPFLESNGREPGLGADTGIEWRQAPRDPRYVSEDIHTIAARNDYRMFRDFERVIDKHTGFGPDRTERENFKDALVSTFSTLPKPTSGGSTGIESYTVEAKPRQIASRPVELFLRSLAPRRRSPSRPDCQSFQRQL